MHEFELIARLKPLLPANDFVVVGVGDDCAVLDLGDPEHQTLFKTDAIVEGIHFNRETEPARVGHKALARCLSDIAAMGGLPVAALVTLALPRVPDADWCEQLYRGLGRTAARYHVAVVGGETTTNPERILVSVAVIGRVRRGRAVLRSGARPGDALFVSGELGGSLSGRHLDFEPRLIEAQWLAEKFELHAMIDLSDGLAGDLRQMLTASGGIGADIHAPALPVSRAAREQARSSNRAKPALLAALTDGEDFELLFCVAPGGAVKVLDGWKQRFPGVPLACIGRVHAGPELVLRDRDGVKPMPRGGFRHFQSPE